MNVLPSRRLLACLALAAPLFLVGVWAAVAALVCLIAAAWLDWPRRPDDWLRVERRVPARVSLGAIVEIAVTVSSSLPRPVRVLVTDDLPWTLPREGSDRFDVWVPPRGRARMAYRVRAAERGMSVLGEIHVRVPGPLGLVWRQWRVPAAGTIEVQPGVLDVRRHRQLVQRHRLPDAGLRAVRERGAGTAFESLREYRRGDDPRRIDWKATARRGATTVRQYEAERSQLVLLAIDAGRLMAERIDGRERLDHALAAALLLADVAAAHGDRVGVFVFADTVQQFLPPRRVPLAVLAAAFAKVETRMAEPDYPAAFGYLARHLRRRALVVLFTDLIDARASAALLGHLNAAARRHLPLVVTLRNPSLDEAARSPVSGEADVYRRAAAEELLQARAHALAAMHRSGVLVADLPPRDVTPGVVNRYLDVKRRSLL